MQVTQVTQLRHFCFSDASDGLEHLLVELQANTNTSDRFSTTHNPERGREDEQDGTELAAVRHYSSPERAKVKRLCVCCVLITRCEDSFAKKQ